MNLNTLMCKKNSDSIKKKSFPLLCGSSPECLSSPLGHFTNLCQRGGFFWILLCSALRRNKCIFKRHAIILFSKLHFTVIGSWMFCYFMKKLFIFSNKKCTRSEISKLLWYTLVNKMMLGKIPQYMHIYLFINYMYVLSLLTSI